MELFAVTLPNVPSDAADRLKGLFLKELEGNQDGSDETIKIDLVHRENVSFLLCKADVKVASLSRTLSAVRQGLSSALADFVLEMKESELIRGIVKSYVYYNEPGEFDKITNYAVQILNEGIMQEETSDLHKTARKAKLLSQFREYLNLHSSIHVDGFIQFRLKEYQQELKEVVDHAIDEYLLDKEYQEFISLLRYFVLVQDPKMAETHVFHVGDCQFQLMHDDFTPVEVEELDSFFQDIVDQDIQYEDIIVSTLINVSPEKVVIHTEETHHNIVKTISSIFEGRVEICNSCDQCLKIKKNNGASQKLIRNQTKSSLDNG